LISHSTTPITTSAMTIVINGMLFLSRNSNGQPAAHSAA
jgi:hypothetical protein